MIEAYIRDTICRLRALADQCDALDGSELFPQPLTGTKEYEAEMGDLRENLIESMIRFAHATNIEAKIRGLSELLRNLADFIAAHS